MSTAPGSSIDVTLVFDGGRTGAELANFHLREVGSLVAMITHGPLPLWASRELPMGETVATVQMPSLAVAKAAVRRCALVRFALEPVAVGTPDSLAAHLGADRASRLAVHALVPRANGPRSRRHLEAVGAALHDAGFGVALEGSREEAVYLLPDALLGTLIGWGLEARQLLRPIEAPNAMPAEQAIVASNLARIDRGAVVVDPCVGGGSTLIAGTHARVRARARTHTHLHSTQARSFSRARR